MNYIEIILILIYPILLFLNLKKIFTFILEYKIDSLETIIIYLGDLIRYIIFQKIHRMTLFQNQVLDI